MNTNPIDRRDETARLEPGQKITSSGFPGSVVRLYIDGPREAARMYEIRLPGGVTCVCGADIIPAATEITEAAVIERIEALKGKRTTVRRIMARERNLIVRGSHREYVSRLTVAIDKLGFNWSCYSNKEFDKAGNEYCLGIVREIMASAI